VKRYLPNDGGTAEMLAATIVNCMGNWRGVTGALDADVTLIVVSRTVG
jgi:hypothetical protein